MIFYWVLIISSICLVVVWGVCFLSLYCLVSLSQFFREVTELTPCRRMEILSHGGENLNLPPASRRQKIASK